MTIYDISRCTARKKIFNEVLEEACRQWCDFINDVPERKSGEGFSDFFFEIFQEKEKEFMNQYREITSNQRKER